MPGSSGRLAGAAARWPMSLICQPELILVKRRRAVRAGRQRRPVDDHRELQRRGLLVAAARVESAVDPGDHRHEHRQQAERVRRPLQDRHTQERSRRGFLSRRAASGAGACRAGGAGAGCLACARGRLGCTRRAAPAWRTAVASDPAGTGAAWVARACVGDRCDHAVLELSGRLGPHLLGLEQAREARRARRARQASATRRRSPARYAIRSLSLALNTAPCRWGAAERTIRASLVLRKSKHRFSFFAQMAEQQRPAVCVPGTTWT